MTTYLDDKATIFSFNFGDGLGTSYSNTNKTYEDFVNINGTLYKLDQTILELDPSNLTSIHYFKTINTEKKFIDRSCNIHFVPIGV